MIRNLQTWSWSCYFGLDLGLVSSGLGLVLVLRIWSCSGADLTGGHSRSGRRGPWEAGPLRPPGFGAPEG